MPTLMDGHSVEDRDWIFNLMMQSELFNPKSRDGKVFVVPDYNEQREITMERLGNGVFRGWLTGNGFADEMRNLHFPRGDAIQFFWRKKASCQVSKALLAEYVAVKRRNKPFKDLGLEHMNKSLPTAPLQLTVSTVRSTQFQNDIFCLRERDLLHRFSDEVSRYRAQGETKESAFIVSYQLAEDLGRAFSDRTVLQTFIAAENNVTDVPLKSVSSLLRSMYVMVTLDEDAAFLRYGYLTVENADAFLSPIAFDWVAANSWSELLGIRFSDSGA